MDHLAPTAGIAALGKPAPPVIHRIAEHVFSFIETRAWPMRVVGSQMGKDEGGLFALIERKVGCNAIADSLQRHRGSQSQAGAGTVKSRSMRIDMSLMRRSRII